MVSQLFLDKAIATNEAISDETNQLEEDVSAYHSCLVANYMAYLRAAGYSKLPQEIRIFERAAWRFLARFPDPRSWLALPPEEQNNCGRKERSFLHYLLLRRILPMPVGYMFTRKSRFFQMAIRLMERDTYEVYRKASLRLGYSEQNAGDQFRAVLCLMIWTQKRIDDLTLDDLDNFSRELRAAYVEFEVGRRRRKKVANGLPKRWDNQLKSIRNVLYHMGIFPQLNRSKRNKSFEKQWEKVSPDIAAVVKRYLQQVGLSLRPDSTYQEKTRLFRFFDWLAGSNPEVYRLDQIQRRHIEAYKEYLHWAPLQHKSNGPGDVLMPATKYHLLATLYYFFIRISQWQWPEAPKRVLVFPGDFPIIDRPSPKFLDEVAAARFLDGQETPRPVYEALRRHSDADWHAAG